jgi:hypothetical protein
LLGSKKEILFILKGWRQLFCPNNSTFIFVNSPYSLRHNTSLKFANGQKTFELTILSYTPNVDKRVLKRIINSPIIPKTKKSGFLLLDLFITK